MKKKCLKYSIFTSLIVLKEIITASADFKRLGTMYRVFFCVPKAFKTFKEWWDRTKKLEIAEKAKTSILQKLRESQAIVDQRKEQQSPNLNRNKLRP